MSVEGQNIMNGAVRKTKQGRSAAFFKNLAVAGSDEQKKNWAKNITGSQELWAIRPGPASKGGTK